MSGRAFIVAIDGPAGAGKSTVSKILARRLRFSLVDTGAIYRCVALLALRGGVALDDDAKLGPLLNRLRMSFEFSGEEIRVMLDSEDVSTAIRTPEVSMAASKVSGRPAVRQGLLGLQRRLALESERGAILEGRDIGTVVFPDADLKFFLEASADARARRRYQELSQKGVEISFDEVLSDQTKRDRDDSTRAVAPLRAAPDAIRMDSTQMPISEVVQAIENTIRERLAQRAQATSSPPGRGDPRR
jgi:CMP/dCMP kinase